MPVRWRPSRRHSTRSASNELRQLGLTVSPAGESQVRPPTNLEKAIRLKQAGKVLETR